MLSEHAGMFGGTRGESGSYPALPEALNSGTVLELCRASYCN